MTNKTLTLWRRRPVVPLVGLLLFAACNQQTDADRASISPAGSTASTDQASQQLVPCAAPELQPVDRATVRPARTVAYPSEELDGPRVSRPFAQVNPRLPLPPVVQPPSTVYGARPLPPAADELAPPTVTMGEPPPAQRPGQNIGPERMARVPARLSSQARNRLPEHAVRADGPRSVPVAGAPADGMQAVTQQAEQMIRRGYHLAERGALYSGRAEFIQALGTIAQALDLRTRSREHTQALAAGLTALEEAEDFVPSGSALAADVDVAMLIDAHRTPVCKELDPASLLTVTALQHYYTYAQEQLALAAGGEEAASMALYGLGKTYSTLAIEKTLPATVAEPKAMVFHWAALSAYAGNFLAANELAVLEARWGQYATARSLLQYSLAILPHSAVWRNLATVHRQLGEAKLADLAMREADNAGQREATAKPGNPEGIVPSSDVEWLDSKEFAATSRSEIDPQKPIASSETSSAANARPVVAPAPPRQRSAAAWFPWLR